MAELSPRSSTTDIGSSRDPFELERLAEELESREGIRNSLRDLDDADLHDLPIHVPLSHDNEYLTAQEFNVEEFLLSRSYISLPDLRSELRQYLSSLKDELVKLINDDYEAFISLSTDLRDEGARLEKLKRPLGGLKSEIIKSKQELCLIQNNIQEKLRKRAVLREEKALLQLLLKISDSVTRLEKLLAITSPEQIDVDSLDLSNSNLSLQLSNSEENADEKLPANRARHLARVATEYTQLLYHVSKARNENCSFVNEIEWRIERIQSTISSDLDNMFSTTLASLTEGKPESRGTELERTKWLADLIEYLRTYDMLGLWRDAEDVIRRQVVRKFVKKTIFPGALAAPHSPLVPLTPFHPNLPEPLLSASFLGPQTPYTPFTAFIPKQNSNFSVRGPTSQKHQAYLLDDANDALAQLYNQILRFIERDLCFIMDSADALRSKGATRAQEVPSKGAADDKIETISDSKGFHIMANVVWEEVSRSLQDEIGGVVFSVGKLDEFRKHYETTQAFIRSLELLAPSMYAVESMRSHATYLSFEKRWQLPVYFQLRWKEIIGKLEESLSVTRIEPTSSKEELSPFVTSQAVAVWVAISACWSAEVFIPELCPRFWRLTLQILSRYRTWLSNSLDAADSVIPKGSATGADSRGFSSPAGRPSTPVAGTGETSSAETLAADDALLRQYAAAIVDITAMESSVQIIWKQEVSQVLPDSTESEDALNSVISKLTSMTPTLSSIVISILTRRCCDALLPVRSIPSQFRAMSNKRIPMEPSYFVSTILRPVKQFFGMGVGDGPGSQLKGRFLEDYSTEIFNAITARYINYLATMKKTEESLKRLKKGKKATFSLFANSSTSNDENRDEERIRAQMILDAEAFGRDANTLKVNLDSNEQFATLKEMVYANDGE